MSLFIWVVGAMFALEMTTVLFMLATGKMPKRTPVGLAITAIIDACMMAWAMVLVV